MNSDKYLFIFIILITIFSHKFLERELLKIYYLNLRSTKVVYGIVDNVVDGNSVDGLYRRYTIKYSGIYSMDVISNPTVNNYSLKLGDKVELLTSIINPSFAIHNNKFERKIPFVIIGIFISFYLVLIIRIVYSKA
jgi:hypothetical protein